MKMNTKLGLYLFLSFMQIGCLQAMEQSAEQMLWNAIRDNRYEDIENIIANRPTLNINVRDTEGYTPLLIAIMKAKPRTVNILLGAGADPNMPSLSSGNTPLHVAALFESNIFSRVIIDSLLDHGADATILSRSFRTGDGITAVYIPGKFPDQLSHKIEIKAILQDARENPRYTYLLK